MFLYNLVYGKDVKFIFLNFTIVYRNFKVVYGNRCVLEIKLKKGYEFILKKIWVGIL